MSATYFEGCRPTASSRRRGRPDPFVGTVLDARARLDRRRVRRIGTSPLYALQRRSASSRAPRWAVEIIGVVSLIIWALLIVVTAKYVLFLMLADNKGEGGILSLKALAQRALGQRTTIAFLLGVAGSALFSADAVITPAISVLSALEGLKQVDADLAPYILPATVVILVLPVRRAKPGHGSASRLSSARSWWRSSPSMRPRNRAYRFRLDSCRLEPDPWGQVHRRSRRSGSSSWAASSWRWPGPRRFTRIWAISARGRSRRPGCFSPCRRSELPGPGRADPQRP